MLRMNQEEIMSILTVFFFKKKIKIASMGAHHPSMDGIVCTLPVWIDFEFSFHGNFKFLSYLDYIWSLVR